MKLDLDEKKTDNEIKLDNIYTETTIKFCKLIQKNLDKEDINVVITLVETLNRFTTQSDEPKYSIVMDVLNKIKSRY